MSGRIILVYILLPPFTHIPVGQSIASVSVQLIDLRFFFKFVIPFWCCSFFLHISNTLALVSCTSSLLNA